MFYFILPSSSFFFFFKLRTGGKESREASPCHLPLLVWLVPILVFESDPLEGLFWRSFWFFDITIKKLTGAEYHLAVPRRCQGLSTCRGPVRPGQRLRGRWAMAEALRSHIPQRPRRTQTWLPSSSVCSTDAVRVYVAGTETVGRRWSGSIAPLNLGSSRWHQLSWKATFPLFPHQ